VTLYASASDWALWASRRLAGDSAGYFTAKDGPLVTDGVFTIDITEAGNKVFALNHSAFASNQRLLLDIRSIIERGEHPPDKRSKRFVPKSILNGQQYWTFSAE
jgi:esterase/lipase superfamily enzyme